MTLQKFLKKFTRDEVIIREGSPPSNEIFFLQKGDACVEINDKIVGRIDAGQWFGEMAALLQTNRTATVRALIPCDVLIFRGLDDANLNTVLQKDPKLLRKLLLQMAERMVKSSQRHVHNVEELDVKVERYRKAISGTLFALDRIADKYKSKVMEEVRDHLRASSGIATGDAADMDERAFRTSKKVVLGE